MRNNVFIGSDCRIGNFVEIKNCEIGNESKAAHLSYLGDAEIGNQVNIGAGTITCNYDGGKKNKTTLEDGAFIGSDTQLVAPVTVKKGAYVAAGSSITEDVPAYALGIARGKQVNKKDWTKKNPKKSRNGPAQMPFLRQQGGSDWITSETKTYLPSSIHISCPLPPAPPFRGTPAGS